MQGFFRFRPAAQRDGSRASNLSGLASRLGERPPPLRLNATMRGAVTTRIFEARSAERPRRLSGVRQNKRRVLGPADSLARNTRRTTGTCADRHDSRRDSPSCIEHENESRPTRATIWRPSFTQAESTIRATARANATGTKSTDSPRPRVPSSAFVCRFVPAGTKLALTNRLNLLGSMVGAAWIEHATPPV